MGRTLKIQQGTGFLFENGKKVGQALPKDGKIYICYTDNGNQHITRIEK
ncbi:hypothetical protein [Flagellimonas sp.]